MESHKLQRHISDVLFVSGTYIFYVSENLRVCPLNDIWVVTFTYIVLCERLFQFEYYDKLMGGVEKVHLSSCRPL